MSSYDVVIVGGGPSGVATAIQSSISGLKVAIIETNSKARQRPGEILHPGIESLLKQLDVYDSFQNLEFLIHKGINVTWENSQQIFRPYNPEGTWNGYQIWRPNFDSMLFERVENVGVNIIKPCRALKPILDSNGKVIGVDTDKIKITCSVLIDAAGSANWIARQLSIPIKKYSPPLMAKFGYVKDNQEITNRSEIPSLTANKNGWSWIAQVRSDLYQWINLGFDETSHIPKELSKFSTNGNTHSADVTWRVISQPAGPGFFVTGDAAFVLDPTSSHGMLKAIMSGMMSAHMISKMINDPSLEKQAIKEYSDWIMEWFLHDVKKLQEFYRKHPNPPKWILENLRTFTN